MSTEHEPGTGEVWREREHPLLDVVAWVLAIFAGLSWLVFLTLLGIYLTTDWSAQIEGTLQWANWMLMGLAFLGALAFSGLASLAAYFRYRRIVWLVVGVLMLAVACVDWIVGR